MVISNRTRVVVEPAVSEAYSGKVEAAMATEPDYSRVVAQQRRGAKLVVA